MKIIWQNQLARTLQKSRRICIVGIGNRDKGDDAAGVTCAEMLADRLKGLPNVKVIIAGEVPENYTGEIRKFKPTHTIIIDSTIAGKRPGAVFIVPAEKIADTDVSTHRMPLSMFVKFLEKSIGCRTVITGIEPERIELNGPVSPAVQRALTKIVKYLSEFLLTSKPNQQ